MPRFSVLAQSSALAFFLPATAAFADLTANDVWSDWQAYMASAGYTLNASAITSGGTLTVSDLSMAIDMGDDSGEGTVNMTLHPLRFVENGDGTVSVELPATSTIDVTMMPDAGEDLSATITTTMVGAVMTASGDPGAVTYDFASPRTEIAMTALTVDGVALGADVAAASMVMNNVAYTNQSADGDLRMIDQKSTIDELSYAVSFADPESNDTFELNGTMGGIALEGAGALPVAMDPQDVNAMLNAGMAFGGMFTTQSGAYDMTFNGDDGSGTVNTTSEGSEWVMSFSPEGLAYAVSQLGVSINMLITELPLPLSFAADEMATSVLVPLQKSDDAQEFAWGLALQGLTLSDTIWGLFDPAGQLPRDPASLVLDFSGTAKVLFDFLDPAQAEVLSETGAVPGELNTVALNALELDVAGARLTGAGAFTFDNSDTVTFDGLPRPEGAVDLTLTGGNGLLDTLVNMGLVPEDQAMGARMMMGLFAVPGEGADTLNSRIEVNPEGQVLANGQRLR